MEKENEQQEYISLEEIPQTTSPEIAPSPSITGQSEMTEEIDVGEEISIDENDDPKDTPEEVRCSPRVHGEIPGEPPGENISEDGEDNPSTNKVTVQSAENINDDEIDYVDPKGNEKEVEENTPEKPPLAPSPSPSMQSVSARSVSPDEEPAPKKKGGSSQPPRFKNDVEPAEYIRPVAGAHNRAISSVHCKAMLIIMSTSIIVVFVVIGMVILQGEDDVPNDPSVKGLEGEFNITNLLFNQTYSDKDSPAYRQLSDQFVQTMNETFQISVNFKDYYHKTTVSKIGQWKMAGQSTARPNFEFTLYVKLPNTNDTQTAGYNESVVTTPGATTSSPSVFPIIAEVINYVINVTKSNSFGSFEGEMALSLA